MGTIATPSVDASSISSFGFTFSSGSSASGGAGRNMLARQRGAAAGFHCAGTRRGAIGAAPPTHSTSARWASAILPTVRVLIVPCAADNRRASLVTSLPIIFREANGPRPVDPAAATDSSVGRPRNPHVRCFAERDKLPSIIVWPTAAWKSSLP